MADMTQFEQAVDQVIEDSERLHKVVNGTATETVVTEDGSTIPTVRKALVDNLFFKTPPLPWLAGSYATVFNQLYAFSSSGGIQWWYAPGATATLPVVLPADPTTSPNWRLYNDAAAMASIYAPINSPIFTGNPQAPTPAANSNSNSLATTSFVNTAVANAIAGLSTGSITYANITVTALATLNNLTVNGTTTLNGPVNADNVTGRFQNLVLTKQASTLSFVYTDTTNPTFLKTLLGAYSVQTHSLQTDIIVNGTVAADNTTMSLTGNGNNVFDYVYIRGNTAKATTEPRLDVTGTTRVENLVITGTVTGFTAGVDGQDIAPNSVTTAAGVTVGSDLLVNGTATLGNTTVASLEVLTTLKVDGSSTLIDFTAQSGTITGPFTVGGLSALNGGFTTGTGNGNIGGTLSVTGAATFLAGANITGDVSITGGLTATGDVNLNAGAGTTTVNNLVIQGTVTGFVPDLTGQSVNVANLTATGNVATNTLSATTATLTSASIGFLTLDSEDVDSSTTTWAPSGTANIYTVLVDSTLTIGPWPNPPGAFSAVIYLTQDATGGHVVTLDPNYLVLNTETVNTDPASVTILQLTFNGVADGVIDTVIVRRP